MPVNQGFFEIINHFSRKSDILICDEAESAMDILTKKRFIELLENDKERIKVSITHTIDDSLKEYDMILYFKNGILVEQGSFDDLYSKKKEFYKFSTKMVDYLKKVLIYGHISRISS